MDQLRVDQELVESLGGTVEGAKGTEVAAAEPAVSDVEIFDIDSVEYEGRSVLPVMACVVIVVLILGIVVVIYASKPRKYDDIA